MNLTAEQARLEPRRGLTMAARSFAVTDVEVRMPDGDETRAKFVGHASVTGIGYAMYGGPEKGGWTEYVDKGSFRKTLRENPDVAFLINHGGVTMARTKAGSLRLAEDEVGLAADADIDTRRPDVLTAVLAMEGGELDEMSFAFRTTRQVWLNADGDEVPWWDLEGI
jgi:HK97 family phage prohead protease